MYSEMAFRERMVAWVEEKAPFLRLAVRKPRQRSIASALS